MDKNWFKIPEDAITPIPENLKGESILLLQEVRIEPDGSIKHNWFGTVLNGGAYSHLGEERGSPQAVLALLSRKLQTRPKTRSARR